MFTMAFKFGLTVLLSSFMLATAVSFLKFRIKKRESDYRRIIRTLHIAEDEARFSTRSISEEYAPQDYFLPVAFVTVTSLFGFAALFFGQELVTANVGKPNIVLTGVATGSTDKLQLLRQQSMVVLTMAFIGAFMWSAQAIIRRLIAGDLSPSTYYSAAVRMLFATVLSLMLSFLLESTPTRDYTREMLPVVAFLTGMLPEQAMVYLRDRVAIFSRRSEDSAYKFPLMMIEGINAFHRVRLSEVGIDNAQNLAEANIIELLLKTPFNPCQLIDWIAQAKLYVYFKSDIEALRRIGVRTIFDLRHVCGDEQKVEQLAQAAQVSGISLTVVCNRMMEDQSIMRLFEFDRKLNVMPAEGAPADESG